MVPRRTIAYETVTGMHTLCGMRALSDHIVKDCYSRPVICVYDYHPGRVGKALAAQQADTNDTSTGAGRWTRMRRSPSTKPPEPPPPPSPAATSYVLLGGDEEMSCLVKEIPIPDGLLVTNLMCVLCEHAVVLLEVGETHIFEIESHSLIFIYS